MYRVHTKYIKITLIE